MEGEAGIVRNFWKNNWSWVDNARQVDNWNQLDIQIHAYRIQYINLADLEGIPSYIPPSERRAVKKFIADQIIKVWRLSIERNSPPDILRDEHGLFQHYQPHSRSRNLRNRQLKYLHDAIRALEPIEQHPHTRGRALLEPRQDSFVYIAQPSSSSGLDSGDPLTTMAATSPARGGASPSSSPRLPSPPPMAEIQFGPKSPSIGLANSEFQLDATTEPDDSAGRRIRPGTTAADMANGPPLVDLPQLDSPFQLQEHLKALYSSLTHTDDSTHTVPITRETALQIARPPQISQTETVDKNLWLYELCRFLVLKANLVSVSLMADVPPCSSLTCPEMRASEWQYLCAVHEPPKSCCAIDYCNHTLDWAANVLTSPKHFPSRLQLGGDSGNVYQSMRQLTNIFRRVYRIFAHAWFQHREIFWNVEAVYGIYIFFKTVCDEYSLIPDDNYTVPPEAEGSRDFDDESQDTSTGSDTGSQIQILRKDDDPQPHENGHEVEEPQSNTAANTAATTRRHRHTPSTGSHVGTIAEGQEEDEEASAQTDALKEVANASPPKQAPPTLGRLDIEGTVPSYVPRAPEDPTPTPTSYTENPFAAAARIDRPAESENAILETEDVVMGEKPDEEDDGNETMERIELPPSPQLPPSSSPPQQQKAVNQTSTEEHDAPSKEEADEEKAPADEEEDNKEEMVIGKEMEEDDDNGDDDNANDDGVGKKEKPDTKADD